MHWVARFLFLITAIAWPQAKPEKPAQEMSVCYGRFDAAVQLWESVKRSLTGPDSEAYFANIRNSWFPELCGKVSDVRRKGDVVTLRVVPLGVRDGSVLLIIDGAPAKTAVGAAISFRGIVSSWKRKPYELVLHAGPADVQLVK